MRPLLALTAWPPPGDLPCRGTQADMSTAGLLYDHSDGGPPVSRGHALFGSAPPHLLRNSPAPGLILPCPYHDDPDRGNESKVYDRLRAHPRRRPTGSGRVRARMRRAWT